MATTISAQDIIDAKRDIDDIGKAVNQKEVVHPRYGDSFKSLPMIVDEFQISSDAAEAAAQSAQDSANIAQSSSQIAQSSANIAEAAATAATISAGVFETPEAGVDPVTGVPDSAYFNVRSSSDESYIDEYQNVGGSAVATGKKYPSNMAKWDASLVIDGDKTQEQINDEIKAINELQALHNKASATFTDYLTANEIANSTTTDLSTKLQAINDTGEISKLRIDRDFYINDPVVFNRDFYFDFDPDANFIFGVNGSIKFEGSVELIGKPTANITKASRTIQINHGGSLSPHDLICIYNPTDFSFSPNKNTYRAGEFIEVGTIPNSTSIITAGKPYADYVAADVDVYKIKPITIGFNAFNVKSGNAALNNPVTFSLCRALDLTKYRNFGSKSSGLALDRCFDVSIFASQATNNSPLVGLNYGISIANSQRVNIYGASGVAARHAVSTGGGNDICSVPCREINVMDSTIRTSNTASIAAADFHGNAEYCKYINCNIDHFSGGGRNITLENCNIFGRDADGSNIILTDVSGGSLNINDCTLHVNGNMTTSRGIIDITIDEGLYEDLVINVNNLKVKGTNGAVGVGYIIRIATANVITITNKITVNVNGLESSLNDHASIVWIQGGTSQPILPDVEINQSNIITKKKGIYYVHPTTTATASSTKYNLPTQKGSDLITTASEANGIKLGSVITFPYYYPIAPIITHGIGTDGAWTVDSSFSLKPVEVMYSTNTPTQLRFALVSPSALPAKTFKLSYQVGL